MIHILIFALFLILPSQGGWLSRQSQHPRYEALRDGDVVFQDTGGEQGAAIRAATKSPYTHCGVVFENQGSLYVLEAVQPVRVTTLAAWKQRSKVFHARRLKDASKLNPANLKKAIQWGSAQIGKDYDHLFKWDDENLYCSELVWKIYHKSTGLSLCKPNSFHSYFLDDPAVREIVRQRYGGLKNLPAQEPVVAPSDLAASILLTEVPRRSKKS